MNELSVGPESKEPLSTTVFVEIEVGKLGSLPEDIISHCPPSSLIFNIYEKISLTSEELKMLQASIRAKGNCSGEPEENDSSQFTIAHYLEHLTTDHLLMDNLIPKGIKRGTPLATTLSYEYDGELKSGFYFRKGLVSEKVQKQKVAESAQFLNRFISRNRGI